MFLFLKAFVEQKHKSWDLIYKTDLNKFRVMQSLRQKLHAFLHRSKKILRLR